MGDRGNIEINGVWLYTHWGGSELKATLKAALKNGVGRWNDTTYLTRIIFSEMVKGDESGTTGYGISTHMPDNEHDILHVETETQRVIERTEGGKVIKTTSFKQFVG